MQADKEKAPNSVWLLALRWIGLLPLTFVGMMIIRLLSIMGMQRMGVEPTDLLSQLYLNVIDGIFFVLIGSRIAPAHQKETALVLGGIVLLLCGMSIGYYMLIRSWMDVLCVLVMAISGAATAFGVQSDANPLD